MIKFYSIVFILTISNFISATESLTCKKYDVLEIKVHAELKIDKPLETQFGAVFRNENNNTINIPGFYNGNNEYLIRFCPEETGNWTAITYSTSSELSGKKFNIEVKENNNKKNHGPVLIDKNNPKRFIYADGTPLFINSYELDWAFALDYGNEKGIPRTEALVDYLKNNGINQLIINVYAYDAGWGEKEKILPEHNFAQPAAYPFGGSNEKPDYSTLNIEFFKHLDRVIEHMNDQNILAHLMIYVWNKKVNWPPMHSKADNMYFDYVVKRYQAYPNMLFNFGKEALSYGYCDMEYVAERMQRMQKLDAHNRLKTVHDYEFCKHHPGLVDYISIQSWSANVYDVMSDLQVEFPQKPIFNIEHGGYVEGTLAVFEGAYQNAETCLERNYMCAFAGAYSNHYWQNMAWYHVIYDPWNLPKEQQPKLQYIKYMTEFFEKYNFSTLNRNPDYTAGINLVNNDKTLFLFLMLPNSYVHGGMGELIKGKTLTKQFFNPLTGEYSEKEEKFQKSGWLGLVSPDEWPMDQIRIAIVEVKE